MALVATSVMAPVATLGADLLALDSVARLRTQPEGARTELGKLLALCPSGSMVIWLISALCAVFVSLFGINVRRP